MLHKRLLKLRVDGKMTQKEFSAKLGIARTTYSGYELGTSEPDNDTLQKLADYYGVTTDYLLGRDSKGEVNKEETEIERINRETNEYLKMAKTVEQAKLVRDLAKNVFNK